MTRTERPRPYQFRLDQASGVPVYRQLIDQVQGALASGTLRMSGSRKLAGCAHPAPAPLACEPLEARAFENEPFVTEDSTFLVDVELVIARDPQVPAKQ